MKSKPRLFAEKREGSATREFKGCATRQRKVRVHGPLARLGMLPRTIGWRSGMRWEGRVFMNFLNGFPAPQDLQYFR